MSPGQPFSLQNALTPISKPEQPGRIARQRDPGYDLIGQGRRAFEKKLGFRAPLKDWLVRANAAVGVSGYLATVACAAGLLLALALLPVSWAGIDGWLFLPLAFLGFFISVDAAITLVNRVVTDRFGPAVLPGLELRDGVSSEFRTIVVVPTLLTTQCRNRRTHRAVGNPLSRQPGRRHPVCSAFGLDGLGHRERGWTTMLFWARRLRELSASMPNTGRHRMGLAFSCCIVGGSGTRARASGSDGNASAENCMS